MSFTLIDVPQRSPAWIAARLGRVTGSVADKMLATIKSGEAAARRDLRLRLVCERLTGTSQEDIFVNDIIQRGIDCEPAAFAAYEARTGHVAARSGFLQDDALMIGCSLDGDIDNFVGILELKCPKSATHLRYLREGVVPAEHLAQITHNLFVSGAQWCDFLSFDDRFPAELQTFLLHIDRAEIDLVGYEKKLRAFLDECDREVAALTGWRVLDTAVR